MNSQNTPVSGGNSSRPDERIIQAFRQLVELICRENVVGTVGFSNGIKIQSQYVNKADRITLRPGLSLADLEPALGDDGYLDTLRWSVEGESTSYFISIFGDGIWVGLPNRTLVSPIQQRAVFGFEDTHALKRGGSASVYVSCNTVEDLVRRVLEALNMEDSVVSVYASVESPGALALRAAREVLIAKVPVRQ